jgi:AcrR family transcriptional regulator
VFNSSARTDWREGRRRSARATIVEAAWATVRDAGLAGLSMRDLAARAGITTPTIYAYFESKHHIYDAMFGDAAAEFEARMAAPYDTEDAAEILLAGTRRFVRFCTEDLARYQLLFQRTIPGFEPSAESYAHAVTALEATKRRLAAVGVSDPHHVDLWTALTTGLVDQQVSNDPGGDRWARLVEDAVAMFLTHCQTHAETSFRAASRTPRRAPMRKGVRR